MNDFIKNVIFKKNDINLIIQTTAGCNLRCKHCYEANGHYDSSIMSVNTLREILLKFSSNYNRISICWFGGEPLLAGRIFFENIIKLENECNKLNGTIFRNSIQTNGILLDDELLKLLKDNGFRISFSYDCHFNNILRQKTEKTLTAIKKCNEQNLHVGIISMIFKNNYKMDDQISMINECKKLGISFKFNRIFSEGAAKNNDTFLIPNKEYFEEFKKMFLYWLYNDTYIPFENMNIIINSLYDVSGRECTYNGCMFKWFAIDPNGNLYSCPRFINSEWSFGNISDYNNPKEIFVSKGYLDMVKQVNIRLLTCKKHCKLYKYCKGGCNAQSYYTNDLKNSDTDLCKFTKEIFPFVALTIYNCINNDKINPYCKYLVKNYQEKIIEVYKEIYEA